jgi:hypothetical protein
MGVGFILAACAGETFTAGPRDERDDDGDMKRRGSVLT